MKKFSDEAIQQTRNYYNFNLLPWLENIIKTGTESKDCKKLAFGEDFAKKTVNLYKEYLSGDKFYTLTDINYNQIETEFVRLFGDKKSIAYFFKKYLWGKFREAQTSDGKNISREIIKLLDIKFCPYCNAETIRTDDLLRRSEIDHLLTKSSFSIFSLFLYNLVPACNLCNCEKGNSSNKHINPYFEDMNELSKFNLCDYTEDFVTCVTMAPCVDKLDGQITSFKVDLSARENDIISADIVDNTKNVFKLDIVYNQDEPKKEVLNALQVAWMLNKQSITNVNGMVNTDDKTLQKAIYNLLKIPYNDNEINKYRFSKLKKDILEKRLSE